MASITRFLRRHKLITFGAAAAMACVAFSFISDALDEAEKLASFKTESLEDQYAAYRRHLVYFRCTDEAGNTSFPAPANEKEYAAYANNRRCALKF